MYFGFDYNLAIGRQAELLRWAEDQRKVKQARSLHSEWATPPKAADRDVIRSLEQDDPGERRAS